MVDFVKICGQDPVIAAAANEFAGCAMIDIHFFSTGTRNISGKQKSPSSKTPD